MFLFDSDFDRIFDRLQRNNLPMWTVIERSGVPKSYLSGAEINETDEAFTVEFPLAGYDKDDLEIEFEKGYLTVKAEISEDDQTKLRKTFSETVYVSTDVDADKLTATFEKSVLAVVLPKENKARKISIS